MDSLVRLRTTGVAKGGDALARLDDGRVVFVRGALPDELVDVRVVEQKRDFARAIVSAVIEASRWRVDEPCRFVAEGCGGCDLQHVSAEGQRAIKLRIVEDALGRVGRFSSWPDVRVVALPNTGYRTTVRGLVAGGRFGYRARQSHEAVGVKECLVAHPRLAELISDGRFGQAREVTLRASVATGERMARCVPHTSGVVLPDDVAVVGPKGQAFLHETVAGVSLRVSAQSFFQARPDGAEALVRAVSAMIDDLDRVGTAVDLYAGVGLFAATALAGWESVVAVEQAASSVEDCRVNLAATLGPVGEVIRSDVERWTPRAASVVVADPARTGLGAGGVAAVAATRAPRVVLISCDPAAFARDAALLAKQAYSLVDIVLVDMFPHTSHIELVSRFDLAGPTSA